MKCRALREGFAGTSLVAEGEEFEFDRCPSWAVPVEGEEPRKHGTPKKNTRNAEPKEEEPLFGE